MTAANKSRPPGRAATMARIASNFPASLQQRDQWVLWRLEQRGDKTTKIPYQPSGAHARSTDPATWSDFATAQQAFINDASFSGIGFVFSKDDPFVGIDLDKCRDPDTGEVEPWATAVLVRFDSYAELSPSGKGFHIIGQGKLPPNGRRKAQIEMYDSGRYFTVTGERWEQAPTEAADIQPSLTAFHLDVFGEPKKLPGKKAQRAANDPTMAQHLPPGPPPQGDQAVLAAILASPDAAARAQFQAGNWQASGYPSQSEADLAWAGMLARYAGPQPEQIDRLFRASAMFRPKWDEQRGAQTYGEMTIAKALEGLASSDATSDLVSRMNQRFAIVNVGNQLKILDEGTSKGDDIKLLSRPDFALQTANMASPKKSVSAANVWLQSPQRRTYKGMVFSPGRDIPDQYNLWRGFSVEPTPGACTLFWQLAEHGICAGDPTLFAYVRCYCAHLIQRSWERPEVALILRGGQGTGKNTFVDTLGALVSHHFRQVNSTDQLTGRFNGHMKGILLLHANEASWGGNKSERGKLKAMVTDATVPIDSKGQDIIDIGNYLRLVVSSNEDWPVPIDLDDRRFLVLDVSAVYQQNKNFFEALHQQMNNGGREALMHELSTIDINVFSPRNKPASPFGADMKIRSADSTTRWLHDVLHANAWAKGDTMFVQAGSPAEIQKEALFADYQDWARAAADRHPIGRDQFHKTVHKLLGGTMTEVRPAAVAPGQSRARKLVFSDIAACRQAFEQATKTVGTLSWDAI